MRLSSGGGVVFSSCCSGGDGCSGMGVMATLGSGGGGGQTSDPVTGDPRSASLASDLGARVSVGLHIGSTRILAVRLGASLDGELSTGLISTGSSSSSSSTTATLLLPPSNSVMKASCTLAQLGRGKGPNHGWSKGALVDLLERWLGLRVPSASMSVARGERNDGLLRTVTLGLVVLTGAWLEVPASGSPSVQRRWSISRATLGTVRWTTMPHRPRRRGQCQ
jgi:hypothetical protein